MSDERLRREKAQIRLLKRLIMSYQNFQQARFIATYIRDQNFQNKCDRLRGKQRYKLQRLWQALNCAMVVAYGRPFSGNDKRSKEPIPDLPKRYIKKLSSKGQEYHYLAMQDRDTVLAHSDSEAWALKLVFYQTTKNKILFMQHKDAKGPLVIEVVIQLIENCKIFMDEIMVERARLEEELYQVIPSSNDPQETFELLKCDIP